MAIKNKGRTKQRSVSRGPRREPVPVPKPFVQRRWVQLVAIFMVGLLVAWVFTWARGRLRSYRDDDKAAQALVTRQQALSKWKTVVESQVSAVGQLQGEIPPVVASDISAAIQALANGTDPKSKAADLQASADELGKAAKAIDTFDLSGTISGQGFDVAGSTALTASKAELVQALELYQQAAKLAVLAMAADGSTRTELASSAQSVEDSATSLLQSGWIKYSSTLSQNQLSAGGTASGLPSGLSGGLSGGTG
jgi:hypothetical protein